MTPKEFFEKVAAIHKNLYDVPESRDIQNIEATRLDRAIIQTLSAMYKLISEADKEDWTC